MSKLNLTLSDPIQAQEQTVELIKWFKEASEKDKRKIKLALLKAIKKSQSLNQTLIASTYRQALSRMQ